MTPDARLLQALLRTNFNAFIQKSFGTLAPGQEFIPSWAISAIAYHSDCVLKGKIRRLIINLPPRSLKSIISSVALPAFALGLRPSSRIICVSYSGDLAKKHANDFRALIEAPWYRALFPGVRIGQKNSETEIETTARGFRMATSIGGTLTGRGAEMIIIDDPLKPDDAMSEAKRTVANEWFRSTLLSRLDDKRTGAIIIVMQRVHMDDLTGYVMSLGDDWTVLNLPAIAEIDEDIRISPTEVYHRKAGEALFPEREPLAILEGLRRQLGSDAFFAQYQQSPVPPGGSMIKRTWIKRYRDLPSPDEQSYFFQSWDTASKGGPDNDFSVCTTWLRMQPGTFFLADVVRERMDFPLLKAKVISHSKLWRPRRVLIEDIGVGTALFQELRGKVAGLVSVRPDRDKVTRMSAVSAVFESGLVYLPESAPWLADFEAELFAFPGSRHDDQVDSVSQALADGTRRQPMFISDALLARLDQPASWSLRDWTL